MAIHFKPPFFSPGLYHFRTTDLDSISEYVFYSSAARLGGLTRAGSTFQHGRVALSVRPPVLVWPERRTFSESLVCSFALETGALLGRAHFRFFGSFSLFPVIRAAYVTRERNIGLYFIQRRSQRVTRSVMHAT